MVVTILAVVCLLLLAFVTAAGYRAVIKGSGPSSAPETERCAVCRSAFAKADLVERQIGDYKLLYFCRPCITRLASDAGLNS